MQLTVLAAGLGERFGGAKQLCPVGPGGESILDYTAHDALAAGFEEIVLVIRPEIEAEVCSRARRWPLRPTLVFQDPGRRGTAHALLAARGALRGAFAVANADDLYGREAFRAIRDHLAGTGAEAPGEHAVVTFRAGDSFAGHGPVRRGVCRLDGDGRLASIEEREVLRRADGSLVGAAEADQVSMNLWGFLPGVWARLEGAAFGHGRGPAPSTGADELLLPGVVGQMLAERGAMVRALPQAGRCVGLTNPEDREVVVAEIDSLVEQGLYPSTLWSKR